MHVSFFWSKKPVVNQEYQVVGNRVSLSQPTSAFTYKNHKIPDGTVLTFKGVVQDRGNKKEHLFLWKERHLEGYLHPAMEGAIKAGFLLPIDKHAKRVAARYFRHKARK